MYAKRTRSFFPDQECHPVTVLINITLLLRENRVVYTYSV